MVKKYRLNIRLKIIYISIVILFVFVLACLFSRRLELFHRL